MNLKVDVNARSKVGRTSLHDAVTLGHVDVAETLLDNDANPNCVARTDEMESSYELQDEMADMVKPNSSMVTPLELACYQKSVEMTKVLLRRGAKDLGNKCLLHVIANNDEELIDVLLGKGEFLEFEGEAGGAEMPQRHEATSCFAEQKRLPWQLCHGSISAACHTDYVSGMYRLILATYSES